MDETQRLLAALGAASFEDAIVAINNGNDIFRQLKQATGKDKVEEALSELQARAARAPFAQSVEAAVGKTGDEAIGMIRAALASHAELPKAQARVAELEAKDEAHSLDTLFAKAKAENKLTPAIEAEVRKAFAAKEVTLKGAESWLSHLTPIAALEKREEAPPPEQTPSGDLKHNGKTFGEMSGLERRALKRENPELYAAMRRAAGLE